MRRNGLSFCLATSILILGINAALVAFASSRRSDLLDPLDLSPYDGTLFEGDCGVMRVFSGEIQLGLAALGVCLFMTATYCMRYLSSPTREDVDRAHAKGTWVEIEAPSIRNLMFMPWKRVFLWVVLLFSAISINFLYSSTVLWTLSSNEYGIVVPDNPVNMTTPSLAADECFAGLVGKNFSSIQDLSPREQFDVLNKEDCIFIQRMPYLNERGTLLLVTTNQTPTSPGLWFGTGNRVVEQDGSRSNWLDDAIEDEEALIDDHFKIRAQRFVGSEVVVKALDESFKFTRGEILEGPKSPDHDLWWDIRDMQIRLQWVEPLSVDRVWKELNHTSRGGTKQQALASLVEVYETESCAPKTRGDEEYTVDYCLSERAEGKCRVVYSWMMAERVIMCNVAILVAILLSLWQQPDSSLLTMGDAVASFLNKPDPTTAHCSWMDKSAILRFITNRQTLKKLEQYFDQPTEKESQSQPCLDSSQPIPTDVKKSGCLPPRRRWFNAVNPIEWILFLTAFSYVLVRIWSLKAELGRRGHSEYIPGHDVHIVANRGLPGSGPRDTWPWFYKLPRHDPESMAYILNTPQLAISILRFMAMGILIRMVTAAEYSSYSVTRKLLCISERSTILCCWYTAILTTLSVLFHWLLTQSLFYTRIIQYNKEGIPQEGTRFAWDKNSQYLISTFAFSWPMTKAAVGVGLMTLVGIVAFGLRRFPSRMPVAANCSLAISAACHPPEGDKAGGEAPVKWGEIPEKKKEKQSGLSSRCGFSSMEVVNPRPSSRYM